MKNRSFEESLGRLEDIVRLLERGEMPLNDSLKAFDEATGLIASCNQMLEQAEQRVIKLRKGEDRTPEELPFEDEKQE